MIYADKKGYYVVSDVGVKDRGAEGFVAVPVVR